MNYIKEGSCLAIHLLQDSTNIKLSFQYHFNASKYN